MIKRLENRFIVYVHINAQTKEIFYVGIGTKGRENRKYKRSERWVNYVKKYGFEHDVLHENLTWQEACDIEKQLIKKLGRVDTGDGLLINMTNGGDGGAGQIGYWKGKKRPQLSEINKDKSIKRKTWLGRKHTPESLLKIGEASKGRIAWNKGIKGVPWTEEMKLSHSMKIKGRKQSEETKKRISDALIGKKRKRRTLYVA